MKSILRTPTLAFITCLMLVASLQASPGVFSELKLPAGASAGIVRVTENFTLVTNPAAGYGGAAVVGEVLVYSNATGKLLRRLRSSTPGANGSFGKLLVAQGHTAYVAEGAFLIHAYSLTTGAKLWTRSTQGTPGAPLNILTAHTGDLAVDGSHLYVGLPEAWTINQPQLGFYTYEGMVLVYDAKTGASLGSLNSTHGEAYGAFGTSVAVGGGYHAIGASSYDNDESASPVENQGMVNVGHVSGWRGQILPPSPTTNLQFGKQVAISGFSLYVGNNLGNAVHHYDLRNLGLIETIPAPMGSTSFGQSLSASGHLVLIGDAAGCWVYDRLTKSITRILSESNAIVGAVNQNFGLCGTLAAGPVGGRVFRAKGVGGGRFAGTQVIAATKQVATGFTTQKYAAMGEMAISNIHIMIHTARLSGAVTTANDFALWNNLSGSHDLVLREGDLLNSKRVGSPFKPFFATGGQARFWTRKSTGALSLWADTGMSATPVMEEGASTWITGFGTPLFVSRLREAVATTGNFSLVNFSLKTSADIQAGNDSFIARPSLLALVEAREGSASGLTGITYGQLAPRIAGSATHLAWSSALLGQPTTASAAVFSKELGVSPPTLLAQKGQPAYGLGGHFTSPVFSSFVGEALSAGGTVYRAKFTSGKTTREGLWFHNLTGDVATHTAPVAWVDGPPPGTATGVKYRRFLKVFLMNSGDVIFMAQVKGTGVTTANDVGIWRRSVAGGQISLIIREGDTLPSSDGATLGSIQRLDVAGGGRWMMLASLGRSPAARNQALFVGHFAGYTTPEIVQRKGDVVDLATPSRLLSFSVGTNNCDAAGIGTKGIAKLAGASHVLHTATFSHSTELVSSTVFGN